MGISDGCGLKKSSMMNAATEALDLTLESYLWRIVLTGGLELQYYHLTFSQEESFVMEVWKEALKVYVLLEEFLGEECFPSMPVVSEVFSGASLVVFLVLHYYHFVAWYYY